MNNAKMSYADILMGWTDLTAGLTSNMPALAHLDAHRQELLQLMTDAQQLNTQQAIQTAAKQDTTRQLQAIFEQGLKLATFLRVGVRQHYGNRSEKLVEFGLQPFRGRHIPAPPVTPPQEATPPLDSE